MERLLGLRILPIVNENDTVATQEIRFGDNDRLAAMVSVLVDADVLVLLSDIDALYTRPPGEPGARKIEDVPFDDDLAGVEFGDIGAAGVGTGGASTKVAAAKLAAGAGIPSCSPRPGASPRRSTAPSSARGSKRHRSKLAACLRPPSHSRSPTSSPPRVRPRACSPRSRRSRRTTR